MTTRATITTRTTTNIHNKSVFSNININLEQSFISITVMAFDPTAADLPVQDVNDDISIREAKDRQIVALWARSDLEDKYLRLKEEHSELKKLSHKQEEKLKLMAAKILRLVKDRKKDDGGVAKEVELLGRVEELEDSVKNLEKQNANLKSKLLVAKQQLATHGKRTTPYDHVKPKVFTGLTPSKLSAAQRQRLKPQLRVQGPIESFHRASPREPPPILPQPRYGHSLLEEARLEKRELEDLVASLQEQLQDLRENCQTLEEEVRQKDVAHEEDMQKLRQQLTGTQRSNIQENIELIKLQREVKDKVAKLQSLQGKYQNLEELLNKVKHSHEQVLEEMEKLTLKLKEEQGRNQSLASELKQGTISQRAIAEKEEQINDLRAEVQLIKEANEKLIHSTFDVEKDREFRAKERQYQIRIAQLEATIKVDVSEKNEVLDKLTSERDSCDELQKRFRELQVQYFSMKEERDEMKEKMKFFTQESIADFSELQEALLLIKMRKEQASQDLSFLQNVDEEKSKDLKKLNQELQAAHADTINELEKTRGMLLIQHNINKDYQREVEITTKKMEELKRECDIRLQEYAQLLDIRAERIKKLEAQLRDVAYGTRQYKIKPGAEVTEDEELDASFELERGQNILEIHMGKATITKDGLQAFGGSDPVTFVSFEFFEYELQATPVAHGASPDYNFTSRYVVQVDDFFLHYLYKESMVVEFHQAFGTEYRTIARGNIRFQDLLDRNHGRLHGTVSLIGVESHLEVMSVDYWIRLRVPMEQAFRLYKERTKALGYITSNALKALDTGKEHVQSESGLNELKITILRCTKLKARAEDVQPHPYCVYKFYDFPDHDTQIIPTSNSPAFHDEGFFPVPMTEELDFYLKNSTLQIYVFDDLETEPATYMGLGSVPLISLSQDKPLKGSFQLVKPDGSPGGSVEVAIQWQYTYLPATAKVRSYPKPTPSSADQADLSSSTAAATLSKRGGTMRPAVVTSGKMFEPHVTPARPKDDSELDERGGSLLVESSTRPTAVPIIAKRFDEPPPSSTATASVPTSRESSRDLLVDKQSKEKPPRARKARAANAIDKHDDDQKLKATQENSSQRGWHEIHESEAEDLGNESDNVALEEELRKTVELDEHESVPMANDTLFEEDRSGSDDDMAGSSFAAGIGGLSDEASEVPNDAGDEEASGSAEDDMVVSSPAPSRTTHKASTSITVIVTSLTLHDNSPLLSMDTISQLFVSYKFLDTDPEELETPISLPVPKANRPIYYNFKKVFHVDEETHELSRQYLMHMLMPDHPSEGRLFFTIVSDPTDDEDADCEDVGIAVVDLVQILRNGKDMLEEDVEVVDLLGSDEVVGSLTVTVEALDALRSLYQ